MARMTSDSDCVVIRLVYDGLPLSGKTTSLRALAEGMARSVFSVADAAGRTEYFDWLEYVGGSFEGIPIRCQILSVPGQDELAARRLAILADADAVVFVLDSTPPHLPHAAARLRDLEGLLASRPVPRPGFVVQANYRDRPEAVALPALREVLGVAEAALVESVATENRGIREAFVLAVRLALERVRELLQQDALARGSGESDSPELLLVRLRALEGQATAPARDSAGPQAPRLPDSSAPIGWVWPPVDGRVVLHSAAPPGGAPRRDGDGAWRLHFAGWHFHSAPHHEFEHLDDARQALLDWAHHHGAGLQRLSPQRCVALADTGWGTWRLWQVVRGMESVRHRLRTALRDSGAAAVADRLPASLALLLSAHDAFSAEPRLPCTLELIGDLDGRPVYTGLLPPPGWSPSPTELAVTGEDLARREVQALLASARQEPAWDQEELTAILEGLLAGG